MEWSDHVRKGSTYLQPTITESRREKIPFNGLSSVEWNLQFTEREWDVSCRLLTSCTPILSGKGVTLVQTPRQV